MHFADVRYGTISEEGQCDYHPEQNQSHTSRECKNFAGIRACLVQPDHTQRSDRRLGWYREKFC